MAAEGAEAEPGGRLSNWAIHLPPALGSILMAVTYGLLSVKNQRTPQYDVNPARWWVKDGDVLSRKMADIHDQPRHVVATVSLYPAVSNLRRPLLLRSVFQQQ